jgi:hypothetical protein
MKSRSAFNTIENYLNQSKMYNEAQIIEIMALRHRRWELLESNEGKSMSDNRSALNTVNRKLYRITGKHQYL